MEIVIAVVVGAAVGAVVSVAAIWLINQRLRSLESTVHGADQRLAQSMNAMQQSLVATGTGSQKALADVSRQLGEISTMARQLAEQTARLSELREALRAPGPRGGLGEVLLENLLRDVLPAGNYAVQHSFADGSRPDAVVRFADRLIPIDAKFPTAGFQALVQASTAEDGKAARRRFLRAVRQHVDDVHRYIRPDEGTVDYALMYVPGENMFHEIVRQERGEDPESAVWRYAQRQRVAPVSPNTLYVYLQTIALALRGMAVERNTRAIQDRLAGLTQEFGEVLGDFDVLGTHLRHARVKYEDVERLLLRLRERLEAPPAELPRHGIAPSRDPDA